MVSTTLVSTVTGRCREPSGTSTNMSASARPTYRSGAAMDSDETVVAEEEQAPTMVAEPKKKAERKEREVPRYHVVLWDSDVHSYEYVERMLRELFAHSPEESHKMA